MCASESQSLCYMTKAWRNKINKATQSLFEGYWLKYFSSYKVVLEISGLRTPNEQCKPRELRLKISS